MGKEIEPPKAMRSKGLLELGIGHVALFRFKSSGVHVAVFLVDVFCLGAKDAFVTLIPRDQYPDPFLGHLFQEEAVELSPGSARNLVEGAVAYAAQLGFAPHRSYAKAFNAFHKIPVGVDEERFTYGQNGQPLFIAGPNESPSRCREIIHTLLKTCGEGRFHYVVPLTDDLGLSPLEEPITGR